ncbi:type VI secretion system tip protein VgrG [Hymenobacter chitinivorans]|uniref:Rhs element Vgr protein n=1 Tax=Hymenobacter chitinivorans DSM 11115 TaxID=1121954 RepID=A0A2M9BS42_9BACT|nr:type VI secretion system tip protein VgrG [Hymenobacter chitinivorans]PJJ60780.1 Rhs element Vgr protein [Hymenobacter chitinivorans DSM 11115]
MPDTSTDLVTYRILADGTEISDAFVVESLEVYKGVNRISTAFIHIHDGSPSDEDFPISDSATFLPGTAITLQAGYHTEDTTIFQGIIVKHGIEVREGQAPMLVLECRDTAVKMTVGRKSQVFADSTDSAAISQIIGTYGLSTAVDSTSTTHASLVQYYCSDWDFIVARAETNGLVVLSEQGKLTVTKPDPSATAALTLTYGDALFSFALQLDASSQYKSVTSQGWDYKNQQMLEATAATPSATGPGNVTSATLAAVVSPDAYTLQTSAALDQPSLQSWANALQLKSVLAKVRGTVKFPGTALVKPGSVVELKGLGARFNGAAYVSEVTHLIADGNWTTEVGLGLDEQWFTERNPDLNNTPAGIVPGVQGLYNAIVTKIDSDPDNQFRVQVTVPIMQNKTLWARLGLPYASSGNGLYTFPEVSDEVILGFFNNDPQFPVILGSLYSSGRAPGYTPDEKNATKAWTTPNKLTIEFDDEKKVITIKTPGNNQLIISDDAKGITLSDQNNNKIELSSSGILLQSAGSIQLKAQTDVQAEASTGNVALKATQKLSLQGLEVEGTAQTQLKMSGAASAELSASGQTTVRGAMVMIN